MRSVGIVPIIEKFLSLAKTNNLKRKLFLPTFNDRRLKVSFGTGVVARIPWIGFPKYPYTISAGIYPVYLYYKDHDILILAYGISETSESTDNWPNAHDLSTIDNWFKENLSDSPDRYGASFVKEVYNLARPLDEIKMEKDLDELLEVYDKIEPTIGSIANEPDDTELDTDPRFWVIAPGDGARKWDEFYNAGIIGIAWEKIENLSKYSSRESIREELRKQYPERGDNQMHNSLALWEFANVMKPGDIVISKRGVSDYLGYGIVTGEYHHDNSRADFKNVRKVEWKKKGVWPEDVNRIVTKTLTDITEYPEYVDRLKRLIGIEQDIEIPNLINYWWLNLQPKRWRIEDFEVGQEHFLGSSNEKGEKRKSYESLKKLKQGDLILGFAAHPIKKMVAIFEVHQSLQMDDDTGDEKVTISVQRILPSPVSLSAIASLPQIDKAGLEQRQSTSLFSISQNEFGLIISEDLKRETEITPFNKSEALRELFIEEASFDNILLTLTHKKNIILQGPPGTGKTFMAKMIAYTLMEEKDDARIEMIQFHQSYAYEDFMQGYRPQENASFRIQNGVFYRFCKKAQSDPNKEYIFVIDEINRGNLSKIFGELMLLLESDKRGQRHAIQLTYSHTLDSKFFIPENVFIIGTMNTADRSLSIVDYALRRRFAFIDVAPNFNEKFSRALLDKGIDDKTVHKIQSKISKLNDNISLKLGKGFQIGHSYFCNVPQRPGQNWYYDIIKLEIAPLLKEYWFDNLESADTEIDNLLGSQ